MTISKMVLDVSLLALCCFIALEGMVLKRLVGEVRWLQKRIRSSAMAADPRELKLGQKIPSFRAEIYPSCTKLTEADLPRASNMFLFMRSGDPASLSPDLLAAMLHNMLGKVEGHVYVFVRGTHRDVSAIDMHFSAHALCVERIRLALDRDGELADQFFVETTPSAVLIDSNGYVRKVGWPVPNTGQPLLSELDGVANEL